MTIPEDFQDRLLALVRDPILPVVFILVGAYLLIRFARAFVHTTVTALFDREVADGTARELSAVEIHKRIETLSTLGTNVIEAFILIIALVMILGQLGLDIAPAIAGLGVVGIAVGFGSQSLVRDYFNGSLILLENQFSRGDVSRSPASPARSRRSACAGPRSATSTGSCTPSPTARSRSRRTGPASGPRINLDVTVAYGTDVDARDRGRQRAWAPTMAADPAWRRIVLEAPRVERVEALGEYGITLKVLGQVRAVEQPAATGELRRRLLLAFTSHGIEIPTPQRVVLAPNAELDPFQPGGSTLQGPTQEDLAAGGD